MKGDHSCTHDTYQYKVAANGKGVGDTMSTGRLTNLGQHDWIAVTLTGNQAYEMTITGLSQFGSVTLGTADALAGDGEGATAIPSTNIG